MSLKENWRKYYNRFIGTRNYFYLSPSHTALLPLTQILPETCRDKNVLDVGAGALTYRYLIQPVAKSYVTIDREREHPDLDVLADAASMPFAPGPFDVIFCSQVLEHTPEPDRIMAEIARVLCPGGTAIITVPHLAYLHGEPHDYFRFTKYGLQVLGEKAGLSAERVVSLGGLLSFIFTPVSIGLLLITHKIPILNHVVFQGNKFWSLFITSIDRKIDPRRLFTLNYLMVFKK
jgi:SAM-dependent methyltransferase